MEILIFYQYLEQTKQKSNESITQLCTNFDVSRKQRFIIKQGKSNWQKSRTNHLLLLENSIKKCKYKSFKQGIAWQKLNPAITLYNKQNKTSHLHINYPRLSLKPPILLIFWLFHRVLDLQTPPGLCLGQGTDFVNCLNLHRLQNLRTEFTKYQS